MDSWVSFIHTPRDDFAATMTDAEEEVWGRHGPRIQRLPVEGSIVLVRPTMGPLNTRICVFELPTRPPRPRSGTAIRVIAEGLARAELWPMRVSLLPGRDESRIRESLARR
ncbi:MAG: hypothetical protein ABIR11_12560 [Candidatus Limnocylindrales bacterium]